MQRRIAHIIENTVRRRTPVGVPPLQVSTRRIYILPTRSGALFAVLLVAMLIGATNYGNNLAFALSFWLGAAALVSMHAVHRNLAGLTATAVRVEPVFAGRQAEFRVTLGNTARRPRRALRVAARDADVAALSPFDIRAGGSADAVIGCTAERRGWLACPTLHIESVYPMGLFRAWTRLIPVAPALVYPAPTGDRAEPTRDRKSADTAHARQRASDTVFAGHRAYRSGDPLRRIDWKASARSTELLVTQYAESRCASSWFDYDDLLDLPRETRLSQLAAWIVAAHRHGSIWGLRLPGITLGPDSGDAHRRACLKALALF